MRAESAKGELWTPLGKHVTRVECGFQVADVLVVVDTALLSKGSRRLIDFKWVQAVIIESVMQMQLYWGGYLHTAETIYI